TIASGAALLYGSGGTSGTPTANSGETVVMERTRREEEEGDSSEILDGDGNDNNDRESYAQDEILSIIKNENYSTSLPTEIAGNAGLQKRYGSSEAEFQAKLKSSEKYLTREDKENISRFDKDKKIFDDVLAKTSDVRGLLMDKNLIDKILSTQNLPEKTIKYLKDLKYAAETFNLYQNQSSINGSMADEQKLNDFIKAQEKSNAYKDSNIALRSSINDFQLAKNWVINARMISFVNPKDGTYSMDKVLDKSQVEFQAYIDNHVSTRKEIINERIDLLHKKADLEKRLEASPTSLEERGRIEKQLREVSDRAAAIDTNIQNYKLNMNENDSNESYVLKVKESYVQERDGLNQLIREMKVEQDRLKSVDPKNQTKIDLIDKQIKDLEKRLETATHGTHRTTEILKFLNREAIELPDGVKNPIGVDSNRKVTLNSGFGWDGYGRLTPDKLYNEILGAGGNHKGIDIRGNIGDRVNSVLDGKFKYKTIGADTTVPDSKVLRAAGIIYLPEGTNSDGSKREAGFYDPNSSKPAEKLTSERIRELDPQIKAGHEFDLKKIGLQHDGKGFYTMDINGSNKERNYLNTDQVASLPSNVREDALKLSGNGNSITIATTIGGIEYDVSYLHLNETPNIPADGKFTAGMQIGTVGTTGSSNGSHLHLEITTREKPNIPVDFYEKGKDGRYIINPEYFLRVMANEANHANGV
ncbi:M23 family metallopeptidase, partial [Leptospira bouyouniensis]